MSQIQIDIVLGAFRFLVSQTVTLCKQASVYAGSPEVRQVQLKRARHSAIEARQCWRQLKREGVVPQRPRAADIAMMGLRA